MFSFGQTPDEETGDQMDANKSEINGGMIPLPDAVVESQTTEQDNTAAEPLEDSNVATESTAAADSQTIEHDSLAVQSNATQDQPLSPTLLASLISIPFPAVDAYTQSLPSATPTKPRQDDGAGSNDPAVLEKSSAACSSLGTHSQSPRLRHQNLTTITVRNVHTPKNLPPGNGRESDIFTPATPHPASASACPFPHRQHPCRPRAQQGGWRRRSRRRRAARR